MVNCKFLAQTPKYSDPDNPTAGYASASVINYNYYASGSQKSDIVFPDESNVAYAWEGYNYKHKNYNTAKVDVYSVIATETDGKNPLFVNFPINDVPLTSYAYTDAWDFHLTASSPALNGAYTGTDMEGLFCTTGLTVGGNQYKTSLAQNYYGAFGRK